MDVKVGDVSIPDPHIVLVLRFEEVDRVRMTCLFEPRLEPIASTIGPKLRAAVQVALDGTAEELKAKGIIKEAQQ